MVLTKMFLKILILFSIVMPKKGVNAGLQGKLIVLKQLTNAKKAEGSATQVSAMFPLTLNLKGFVMKTKDAFVPHQGKVPVSQARPASIKEASATERWRSHCLAARG